MRSEKRRLKATTFMRDKIKGMSKMMGDMSGRMKQMSEGMEMRTKKPQ